MASCSLSSSAHISAGVMGRGCLIGTPTSRALLPIVDDDEVTGLNGGNGTAPPAALIESGTPPPGVESGRGGGFMGYIWVEERREGVAEGRRDGGCACA